MMQMQCKTKVPIYFAITFDEILMLIKISLKLWNIAMI